MIQWSQHLLETIFFYINKSQALIWVWCAVLSHRQTKQKLFVKGHYVTISRRSKSMTSGDWLWTYGLTMPGVVFEKQTLQDGSCTTEEVNWGHRSARRRAAVLVRILTKRNLEWTLFRVHPINLSFFLSWVANNQIMYGTKRVVCTQFIIQDSNNCPRPCLFVCNWSRHTANPREKLTRHTSDAQ